MRHWLILRLDVSNEFLQGHLREELFMDQPPGFHDTSHPDQVCPLNRALYGLKQASKAWFNHLFNHLSSYLLQLGFFCRKADSSLFVLHNDAGTVYLLVYVDDIILTSNNDSLLSNIITWCRIFSKDLGPLHYFLSIEVISSPQGLLLTKAKYAHNILTRASMANFKQVATPIPQEVNFHIESTLLDDLSSYRKTVGALQYLQLTQPDISYAVSLAFQFVQTATATDRQLAK